jgi:histone H3/H4
MVDNKAKTTEQSLHGSELKFHEHARDQAVQQIRTYGQELIRESVSTAQTRKHPLVLQKDVQYAAHRLHTEFRNRKDVLLQFLGAGLLGVFLQGFTAEMMTAEPNLWAVVVYVVVGFMGLFGVFWSLIR